MIRDDEGEKSNTTKESAYKRMWINQLEKNKARYLIL